MTGPAVLSLDEVAVVEVMRLIQAGLVRPGRITNRGAVVYELTEVGVAAFEDFCSEPDAAQELESLREDSEVAKDLKSAKELLTEAGTLVGELQLTLRRPLTKKQHSCLERLAEIFGEYPPEDPPTKP